LRFLSCEFIIKSGSSNFTITSVSEDDEDSEAFARIYSGCWRIMLVSFGGRSFLLNSVYLSSKNETTLVTRFVSLLFGRYSKGFCSFYSLSAWTLW
jgi:hypothetical protein